MVPQNYPRRIFRNACGSVVPASADLYDVWMGAMTFIIFVHMTLTLLHAFLPTHPTHRLLPFYTMKSSTTNTKKITPASRRAKRTDRGVPFEEMRRLMHVYGSVKCLRKRQSKTTPDGADENTKAKVDSVKRKFYRWFPDLDERFTKDEEGLYQPRMGHEFELRYREEMRTKDGEVLAKKRARCRKENKEQVEVGVANKAGKKQRALARTVSMGAEQVTPISPTSTADCARISPNTVTPEPSFSDRDIVLNEAEKELTTLLPFPPDAAVSARLSSSDRLANDDDDAQMTSITLESEFDYDPMASANIATDTEPLDSFFIAEEGIFDEVENSFYGPVMQECPKSEELPSCISSSSSSSSEEEQGSSSRSSSRLCDSASLEDMLAQSIEECCDEILGSDDNNDSDSEIGFFFGMISA